MKPGSLSKTAIMLTEKIIHRSPEKDCQKNKRFQIGVARPRFPAADGLWGYVNGVGNGGLRQPLLCAKALDVLTNIFYVCSIDVHIFSSFIRLS